MSRVALFAALTVALGVVYVPLPFSPVPVTGQSLGPMLAGGILGARKGAASQLIVVLLVALGLPVLAGGRGGLGVLLGPTGGYIAAFPVAAAVIGLGVERMRRRSGRAWLPVLVGVMVLGGVLVVDLVGVTWLSFISGRPWPDAIVVGMLPFLPGDLTKAVAAALVVRSLQVARVPALSWRPAAGESG